MHKTTLPLAAAALLALPVLPALAQAGGTGLGGHAYVGASVGTPRWVDDNLAGVTNGSSAGTGFKGYVGYGITDNFALELGGVDLGRLSGNGLEAKANGVYLDAVGLWPVNPQWTVLGRVGAFNAKLDTPNGNGRGTDIKAGFGLQYNFNANTSLRAEWERYRINAMDVKPSVNLYSVGVNYAF